MDLLDLTHKNYSHNVSAKAIGLEDCRQHGQEPHRICRLSLSARKE